VVVKEAWPDAFRATTTGAPPSKTKETFPWTTFDPTAGAVTVAVNVTGAARFEGLAGTADSTVVVAGGWNSYDGGRGVGVAVDDSIEASAALIPEWCRQERRTDDEGIHAAIDHRTAGENRERARGPTVVCQGRRKARAAGQDGAAGNSAGIRDAGLDQVGAVGRRCIHGGDGIEVLIAYIVGSGGARNDGVCQVQDSGAGETAAEVKDAAAVVIAAIAIAGGIKSDGAIGEGHGAAAVEDGAAVTAASATIVAVAAVPGTTAGRRIEGKRAVGDGHGAAIVENGATHPSTPATGGSSTKASSTAAEAATAVAPLAAAAATTAEAAVAATPATATATRAEAATAAVVVTATATTAKPSSGR